MDFQRQKEAHVAQDVLRGALRPESRPDRVQDAVDAGVLLDKAKDLGYHDGVCRASRDANPYALVVSKARIPISGQISKAVDDGSDTSPVLPLVVDHAPHSTIMAVIMEAR